MVRVKIKILEGGEKPIKKTKGAVCYDCYARCQKAIKINPHTRETIPLGFALELPEGYEAVIRGRSGLAKKGIDVAIGTVDTDYRGEVCATIINDSDIVFYMENGNRVCQMAIREVPEEMLVEVDELTETERGSGGFGHTGIN